MAKDSYKVTLSKWVYSVAKLFRTPTGLITIFFITSILLAIAIIIRFNVVPSVWVIRANIMLYFMTYYLLPAVVILWGFLSFHQRNGRRLTNKMLYVAYIEFLACIVLILSITFFAQLPEYYFLPLPLIVILSISLVLKLVKKSVKLVGVLLIGSMILSFLMPLIAASFSNDQIIKQASDISSKEGQVKFIAQKEMETISGLGLARASNDFQKLLLAGDGACGEGTTFMMKYLRQLGFEVRNIVFTGEDHEFAEVKLNSKWLVVDPGYSLILISELTRGERRVQEAGTLTYVASYNSVGFTELTQQYTGTDSIVIQVTENGQPVTDAAITLKHTLVTDGNSRSVQLPGNNLAFHTDNNGTVLIHVGKIGSQTYNGSFVETDPFYYVCVNGKQTDKRVTSNGNGTTTAINIVMVGT